MKVLVCGDRHYSDRKYLWHVLDREHHLRRFTEVIAGGAAGADTLAAIWATEHHVPFTVVTADWETYGKAAGPIRNQQMLDMGPDMVAAFHQDIEASRGTKHMVTIARAAKVPTQVFSGSSK
jgi:hypothetical protein